MIRKMMTRYEYRLAAVLLARLQEMSDKRDEPINHLITRAIVQMYPECRSFPADVLQSFLQPKQRPT